MKNLKKKYTALSILVLSCLFFCTLAIAEESRLIVDFSVTAWEGTLKVDTQEKVANANPNNCAQGGRYWVVYADSPQKEYIESILVEAQSTQSSVWVSLNGCEGDFPRITSVEY